MGKKTWKQARPLLVTGDIAIIELTRGKQAIIDAADAVLVEAWNWHAVPSRLTWYAWRGDGRRERVKLHNAIMGDGLFDHRDGDGLNNRRSNLRPATQRQNTHNRRPSSSANTSGFKGVSPSKSGWKATIMVDRQSIHLGFYLTKEGAARAYDERATKEFGEFAYLNFPDAQ